MQRFIILTSKNNKYMNHINQIVKDAFFKVNIIYVEDYLEHNDLIKESDLVYILCANYHLVRKIKHISHLINQQFFKKLLNKKDVQNFLKEHHILAPNIFYNYQENAFFKENNHEGIVQKLSTIEEYKQLRSQCPDFYLEESMENIGKEDKLYYIYQDCFSKTNVKIDLGIQEILNRISNLLGLDVFSVDIIYNESKVFVIDVNYSPGFYLCDAARLQFINKMAELLDKMCFALDCNQ